MWLYAYVYARLDNVCVSLWCVTELTRIKLWIVTLTCTRFTRMCMRGVLVDRGMDYPFLRAHGVVRLEHPLQLATGFVVTSLMQAVEIGVVVPVINWNYNEFEWAIETAVNEFKKVKTGRMGAHI